MEADTLAHALEPFFTTKGVGKGTGLGLSMVHGFADQCGGALALDSVRGEGTTVSLWLPIAVGDEASDDPAPPERVVAASTAPMLILAVDDDQLVLTNTVAMLEELGHRVLQATSGADALEILDTQPIDLLITDYAMPEMTGMQLATIAKAQRRELSVVVVSGYVDVEGATGSDARLNKPFRIEELARAVDDVSSRRGSTTP
jgi:CheY-like chemotaxis protein